MRLIGKTGSETLNGPRSTMTCLCSGTKGGIFDARGCWPVIARKACKSLDCDIISEVHGGGCQPLSTDCLACKGFCNFPSKLGRIRSLLCGCKCLASVTAHETPRQVGMSVTDTRAQARNFLEMFAIVGQGGPLWPLATVCTSLMNCESCGANEGPPKTGLPKPGTPRVLHTEDQTPSMAQGQKFHKKSIKAVGRINPDLVLSAQMRKPIWVILGSQGDRLRNAGA